MTHDTGMENLAVLYLRKTVLLLLLPKGSKISSIRSRITIESITLTESEIDSPRAKSTVSLTVLVQHLSLT